MKNIKSDPKRCHFCMFPWQPLPILAFYYDLHFLLLGGTCFKYKVVWYLKRMVFTCSFIWHINVCKICNLHMLNLHKYAKFRHFYLTACQKFSVRFILICGTYKMLIMYSCIWWAIFYIQLGCRELVTKCKNTCFYGNQVADDNCKNLIMDEIHTKA